LICSGTTLAHTFSRNKRGEEEITQMKIDTLFFEALLLTWTSLWARIAIQGFKLALLSTAIEWSLLNKRTRGNVSSETYPQQIQPCRLGIGVTKEIVNEGVTRDYTKIYIDGEWIQPSGGQALNVINPATEQPAGRNTLAQIAPHTVTRA